MATRRETGTSPGATPGTREQPGNRVVRRVAGTGGRPDTGEGRRAIGALECGPGWARPLHLIHGGAFVMEACVLEGPGHILPHDSPANPQRHAAAHRNDTPDPPAPGLARAGRYLVRKRRGCSQVALRTARGTGRGLGRATVAHSRHSWPPSGPLPAAGPSSLWPRRT